MRLRLLLACAALGIARALPGAGEPSAEASVAYNAAIEMLRRGDDERFEAALASYRELYKDEVRAGNRLVREGADEGLVQLLHRAMGEDQDVEIQWARPMARAAWLS